jgi:cytochrome c oxidase cbb3-type subunit 3
MSKEKHKHTVQTTGHAWDGDLQEFNNPLPNWWLWAFYATVVFAVIYWFLYPTFPYGDTYTKGMMNKIEYTTADGKTVKTHWNTRALYEKDMQAWRVKQAKYIEGLKNASYQDILSDPEKRNFAFSMAKVLFADNCAACHQPGGAGIVGMYPNLADDSWLWGGEFAQIETTIREGRNGNMPSFGKQLDENQISDLAEYVLSLSGEVEDTQAIARGKNLFNGSAGCAGCHTDKGTGNIALGSANLTDKIWTVAKVPAASSHAARKAEIRKVIKHGISRKMPVWKTRLSDMEIRMLTLYVHELSGGGDFASAH